MPNFHRVEKGQVLILLVVGVVVLMGFTALAIDGGMIYSQRRFDQNTADSAALAGGGKTLESYKTIQADGGPVNYMNWSCNTGGNGETARAQAILGAQQNATINGLTIPEKVNTGSLAYNDLDPGHAETNYVEAICRDFNNGAFHERWIEIHTHVFSQTKTNFAHLVFGGELKNQVDSYVRVWPLAAAGLGNTIVAMDPNACSGSGHGIVFKGSNVTNITNGGLFSFGCIQKNGAATVLDPGAIDTNHYMADDPNGYDANGGGVGTGYIQPPPTHTDVPLTIKINPPNCGMYTTSYGDLNVSGNETINPGKYGKITLNNSGDILAMNPGLYCFEGGIKNNGGKITGVGVTLAFITGGINDQGNPSNTLISPGLNPVNGAIQGLLIYVYPGNTSQIDIQGTSTDNFTGTIYAPQSLIDVGGNTNLPGTLGTQIIGYDVVVHGNPTINASYSYDSVYFNPGYLNLQK